MPLKQREKAVGKDKAKDAGTHQVVCILIAAEVIPIADNHIGHKGVGLRTLRWPKREERRPSAVAHNLKH